jgi:hypothetical protein
VNVKLLETMAQLAPPIGPRPFMVFGVRRAGVDACAPLISLGSDD